MSNRTKRGRSDGWEDVSIRQLSIMRDQHLHLASVVGTYVFFSQLREIIEVCRHDDEQKSVSQSSSKRWFNTLWPRRNGRHVPDEIFKCIFLNENIRISMKISLKFIPKGPIDNIPALVQIMVWCRPGHKSLSEPIMVRLPTHICVTRRQWVEGGVYCVYFVLYIFCVLADIVTQFNESTMNCQYGNNCAHVTVKPTYNDHLMGYFSAFWSSYMWPLAT